MTARLVVDSLIMWSAQVLVLVGAAAVGCRWLPHARARLWVWQAVLGVSLLLPLIMPTRLPEQILVTQGVDDGLVNVSTHVIVKAPSREQFWRGEAVLWIVASVAVARLLWLMFGVFRLRRLRAGAEYLADPPILSDRAASWYVSDAVPGPVTFGWKRPSILLPRRVLEMPRELLEAVAGHELIHVFRRDWIVVLAEEFLRSLFWFHPAVWFALGEIQIAREEVVDAEAVNLTRDRENYLDALLAVAEQRMVQDLAPAPLFLKKHQLARRVATLVKENSMSKLNLGARVALVVTATLAGLGSAAWFFPFPSAAHAVPDDPGISVVAGGQLMHRPALHLGKTSGLVVLDASLDSKGEVVDAHVVSGPDELRREALANVLQWHYAGNGSPTSVRASIQFGLPAVVAQPSAPPPPPPPPPPGFTAPAPPVLKDIVFVGVDPGVQDQIRNQLQLHSGDALTGQAVFAALNALRGIDEHLTLAVMSRKKADGSVSEANVRITVRPDASQMPAGLPLVNAIRATDGPQPLRVGGNVQAVNLINKVTPAYPPLAKQARIQGAVRFNATIGTDGTVKNLELVSGHPLLAAAAQEAVKQWVYKPTLLNGQPVEVETQIDVNFSLSE
jgi:periplasmic protein TonB